MDLPQFVNVLDLHRNVIEAEVSGRRGVDRCLEQRQVVMDLAAGQEGAVTALARDLEAQYFRVEPFGHRKVLDVEDYVTDALGSNHWSFSCSRLRLIGPV